MTGLAHGEPSLFQARSPPKIAEYRFDDLGPLNEESAPVQNFGYVDLTLAESLKNKPSDR